MKVQSMNFFSAIGFVGKFVELVLAMALEPVRRFFRKLWDKWLSKLFGRIADRISPKRAPAPAGPETPPPAPPTPPGDVPAAEELEEAEAQRRPWSWRVAVCYLVMVAGWALLTIMRRVDSALQQMHFDQGVGGSALGFKVSLGDLRGTLDAETVTGTVTAIRNSWDEYARNVADHTTLRDPSEIAVTLLTLDSVFIVLYALAVGAALVALYRTNALPDPADSPSPDRESEQQNRRSRMIVSGGVALLLLIVVDVIENIALWRAYADGGSVLAIGGLAIGPLMSVLKLLLTVAMIGPPLLVVGILLLKATALRRAVASARGVLIVVAALVLLVSTGIGAAQLDDVVRSWDGLRGLWAFLACVVLAGTVTGATRRLTADDALDRPAPDSGDSAQPFVLGLGLILVALGALLSWIGFGWGLCVAGGLLLAIWVLGLAFDGLPEPPGPGARFLTQIKVGRVRRTPDPGPAPAVHDPAIAAWGDRLGRLAGATVCGLIVGLIARATALDSYIRDAPEFSLLLAPIFSAVAICLLGAFLAVYRTKRVKPKVWSSLWGVCTFVAFAAGFFLLNSYIGIHVSEKAGTVAILLGGFSLMIGVIGLLATQTRKSKVSQYALAPALRAARFKRFPVLAFFVVWILVVSALDPGGYHDIRRMPAQQTMATPTLSDAWQGFLNSHKSTTGSAQPVVMVGAQGGGIRAAVWTALVMECLFGPGPVSGANGVCAHESPSENRTPEEQKADDQKLAEQAMGSVPVFLASGASGGSVGLAAWTARRADLLQDGAASTAPRQVEDALRKDFVAPDIARMLSADLPHALLAWDWPDRAEMLERSWEQAWRRGPDDPSPPANRGMARGLRDLWSTTHGNGLWASPVLAMNGISVEDDCRFVVSAVDFALPAGEVAPYQPADAPPGSSLDQPNDAACRGPVRREVLQQPGGTNRGVSRDEPGGYLDVLPSSNELVDYLCPDEDVPLSTASHLSARFPLVSPSGRIDRRACASGAGLVPEPAVSYVADGGLFDNSGAGTVTDAWRALQPLAAASELGTASGSEAAVGSCLVPIFVQIDNSPPAATRSSQADPRPLELTAPVKATLGQVNSREAYARASAAAAFTRPLSAGGKSIQTADGSSPASLWFRITLAGQPGPEPPLGWTLADATVNEMRSQLTSDTNRQAITELRKLLEADALKCK
ncbi:hypothetical protein OG394_00480 [Kribbella sp. NBC_01245]|uniref:hypothetical protein n=1 Tax=Kribbella sp. NBC_01245 TaxID=2903578 RepID=UPI002E29B03D|nr:hypothetical protein [Kribbella sp. NBC_01245]